MNNINEIRNNITNLIRENNLDPLEKFVSENNIELKILNTDEFNIIQFINSLYNSKSVSKEIKNFIFKNYDKKRKEAMEIIKQNNLDALKEYTTTNNIEFNNFTDEDFNIFLYVLKHYKLKNISYEVKDYVKINYDRTRSEIVALIQKNNTADLIKYINDNHIELESLNDKFFDIVTFCKGGRKNNVSRSMINFVISHLNKHRYTIVELVRAGNKFKIEKYLKENNLELKDLNDDDFNIIDYCMSEFNRIKDYMKQYIILNIDNHHKNIIKLIKNGITDDLKKYFKANNIELKSIDNQYFHCIDFCETDEMKNFITINYTRNRSEIVDFIKNGDIDQLINYLKDNNLELKDVNGENFDIIKFCQSDSSIDDTMTQFVVNHYNRSKIFIIDLLQSGKLSELEEYINENNFEFESLKTNSFNIFQYYNSVNDSNIKKFILKNYNNKMKTIIKFIETDSLDELKNYLNENDLSINKVFDENFNILFYCDSLGNQISSEMKAFIQNQYNTNTNTILNLIKKNDLQELQQYKNENDITFDSFCDETFNIIKTAYSLYNEKVISTDILDFILIHFDEYINSMFSMIKSGDLIQLKNYIYDEKNKFKNKKRYYYDIFKYASSYLKDTVPPETLNFVLNYFERRRNYLINLMQSMNFKKLWEYVEKYEIQDIDNETFNVIEFCIDETNRISSKVKYLIINHYTKTRSDVVELIHNNKIKEILNYLNDKNIELNDLNDNYFDFIEYYNSNRHVNEVTKSFIINHYTKTRSDVVELIHNNKIKEILNYLNDKNIELNDLNDNYFDIIEYCNSNRHVNEVTKSLIKSHLNNKRATITEYIRRYKYYDLERYAKDNEIEFKNMNDEYFNILDYCENEVLNCPERIKNFIIRNYDKIRADIIKLIEGGDIISLKDYIKDKKVELKKLDDAYFKIIDFCSNPKNCKLKMKMFVINHYYQIRSDIVELIRNNNAEELKNYIKNKNINLESLDDENFDLKKYTYSLYNNKKISSEVKDIIIIYTNEKRKITIDFIERNSINGLKIYTEENDFEFKSINDNYFNIINYIRRLCKKDKKYMVIKDYIYIHYDKRIKQIIEMVQKDDLDEFKQFIKENNINYKNIDQNYLTIIYEICFKKVTLFLYYSLQYYYNIL